MKPAQGSPKGRRERRGKTTFPKKLEGGVWGTGGGGTWHDVAGQGEELQERSGPIWSLDRWLWFLLSSSPYHVTASTENTGWRGPDPAQKFIASALWCVSQRWVSNDKFYLAEDIPGIWVTKCPVIFSHMVGFWDHKYFTKQCSWEWAYSWSLFQLRLADWKVSFDTVGHNTFDMCL